ncbi:hypothetical protein LshimejAT787_1003180 [Lyophyllum shimeji]|uniref:Uncharacterized protein n=1 Tax=Lyophyllum shimeji TaxID=47721 RepID=A0A9P3PUA8_LYOSH|nr:hypothetical protein LshimejAT787_1003180 [Lyophyllum shimeji]
MQNGTLAVPIVQRKVMVVQAVRSHARRERYLDVHTYSPFGDRVFLASPVPKARIAPSDVLSIFPSTDVTRAPEQGMLELPPQAFFEFKELSSRHQERCESLWSAWTASH